MVRRGSLAFSPRKRAGREIPSIRSYPTSEKPRVMGFAGYKVGMLHVTMIDDIPNSPTEGTEISVPVTVIETPPMKILRVVVYKQTPYGLKICEDDGDEVRVVMATQPNLITGVPRKTPELMECAVGGNFEEGLKYAKELVGKEITISDVFSPGELVDVVAVTKGKGVQGPVKRWGVKIQPGKAARSSRGRHVGTLGPWHPARVSWRVPQLGQTGYHQRTEYNKRILKIGEDGKEITPKGGFPHYGVIRTQYVILHGSVPGPVKRLVRLRPAIRPWEFKLGEPVITEIVK